MSYAKGQAQNSNGKGVTIAASAAAIISLIAAIISITIANRALATAREASRRSQTATNAANIYQSSCERELKAIRKEVNDTLREARDAGATALRFKRSVDGLNTAVRDAERIERERLDFERSR